VCAKDLFLLARKAPQWDMASSFTKFLDHTQRRATFGRTSLDEWSARRRDLYLTTRNIHNRQTSMPPGGFRTHSLCRREAAELRIRPRGQWVRLRAKVVAAKTNGYYLGTHRCEQDIHRHKYRGADKSLARPWKEASYSDQDWQHHTKTCGAQTTAIYCCCLCNISLGMVL